MPVSSVGICRGSLGTDAPNFYDLYLTHFQGFARIS
jgi:hypothetical protein